MEKRIRMGFKASAKGIVAPDVTVDCTIAEEASAVDVGKFLNESVVEFKKQVTDLGYINSVVEIKK